MNIKERLRLELINSAADVYKETGSIRKTAVELGVNPGTATKLLISAGVYESSLYKKIKPLIEEGLSDEEIAETLGVDRSTVSYNRPYKQRGNNET